MYPFHTFQVYYTVCYQMKSSMVQYFNGYQTGKLGRYYAGMRYVGMFYLSTFPNLGMKTEKDLVLLMHSFGI